MFQVKFTPTAFKAFTILHPNIKKQLKVALLELKKNPYAGKTLRDELSYHRSYKVKRYRVIYKIDENQQNIIIVALGHRRDIYDVTTRLLEEKT